MNKWQQKAIKFAKTVTVEDCRRAAFSGEEVYAPHQLKGMLMKTLELLETSVKVRGSNRFISADELIVEPPAVNSYGREINPLR